MVSLLPYVAGIALAVAGVLLGQWQLRRAGEKAELQQRIEQRENAPVQRLAPGGRFQVWRRAVLRGRWLDVPPVLIDNRTYRRRAGYHVVAPFELEDGRTVLVNRGWLAAAGDRSRLPRVVPPPAGIVEVLGSVREPEADPFRLAPDAAGSRLRQNLIPLEIAALLARPVEPWILAQTGAADDGLVRDWPRPDAGIERHRGYAFQWFGLASLAAGLTVFFGWRRMRHGSRA
ncbi:MAG: SURF1 family protein [Rhodocyclaceae bacterium]|nr:SURF1 family protein [Rhodocyclaceae bacterium]